MTDQELNVKIAEACPELFSVVRYSGGQTCIHYKRQYDSVNGPVEDVNICNDLNAIHEAILGLGDEVLYTEFEEHLNDLMGGIGWITHTTARQRAEAFLKTIEKC